MKFRLFPLFAFAAVALFVPAASAVEITNVTIYSVSNYYPGLEPENIINGNGLNTSTDPGTHASDYVPSYYWETLPYQQTAEIAFDLNGVYDVDSMRVWNFNVVNQNGSYTGRGAHFVTISTSDNAVDWINRGQFEFPIAPGTPDYTGDLFSLLGWTDTRYIDLYISSYYGGGDSAGHIGLSEIRFYTGNGNDVPEPSTAILLGFASFATLLIRRQRTR